MKKKWLIASFKTNEIKRVEVNLRNQKFEYYLPKITIKKLNSNPKESALFPGYIFVNTNFKNISALRFTLGIKDIIRFGDNIPYLSDKDINSVQIIEKTSKIDPISSKIHIGQEAIIKEGPFKGNMVKIFSLSSKERVEVLLTFLGSMRRLAIPEKDLIL